MKRHSGLLRGYASAWRTMGCRCNRPDCGVCIARDPLTINEAEEIADFIDQLVTDKAEAESRAQAAEGDAGRWRRWVPWLRRLRKLPFDLAKELEDTARATQPEGESHE